MDSAIDFICILFSLLVYILVVNIWYKCTCNRCVGRHFHIVGISGTVFVNWIRNNCFYLLLNKVNERKLSFKNLFRLYD